MAYREEYDRSKSYNYSYSYPYPSASYGKNDNMMQLESYHGPPRLPPPPGAASYDLRSYSASYAQAQMGKVRGFKLKKGKSISGSSSSKAWALGDPEFQRKRRVARYKMYTVEGKVKGSLRKSFRWLKHRFTQVVYGWW